MKKYALGYYGKLLGPVDPEVLDRIVNNGSKEIALQPKPLPPAVAALREKYPDVGDDERLLRYMFAGGQVDAMLAAGPMRTQYDFGMPIVELLKALLKTRKAGRVYVSKGALQIELKGVADGSAAR